MRLRRPRTIENYLKAGTAPFCLSLFDISGDTMLRSESFFGKRDNNANTSNATTNSSVSTTHTAGSGSTSASSLSSSRVNASTLSNLPSSVAAVAEAKTQESPAKLTVGPNIKLKGVEITDCDTLVVEGFVEATMDSRLMQIAKGGSFKGSAEIDIAEIHGEFDGTLTVRQKLVIHATGKVTGRIRYGKIVIEEGGQLSGDVECAANGAAKAQSSGAKPSMQLAA